VASTGISALEKRASNKMLRIRLLHYPVRGVGKYGYPSGSANNFGIIFTSQEGSHPINYKLLVLRKLRILILEMN